MAEYCSRSNPSKRAKNGKPSSMMAHRLIWEENKGKIPLGYIIHHKNGNKKDNRIENLLCCSPSEHRRLHPRKNEKEIMERTRLKGLAKEKMKGIWSDNKGNLCD